MKNMLNAEIGVYVISFYLFLGSMPTPKAW